MTWEIFLGIVALVTFVITVVKTIVPLIEAIIRLTDKLESLEKKVDGIEGNSNKAHDELWEHNDKQDAILQDHAMRLHDLDGKGGI